VTAAKRLLRTSTAQAALARVIAGYIRLVRATGPWRTVNGEIPARFWDAGEAFIGAFWHGRLLMIPPIWPPGLPVRMLISDHADGRLIARAVARFGLGTIAGSSRHGGHEALRAMVRALARGVPVAITPDGPRGPRMRAGGAIVDLARLSGRPIVPVGFSSSAAWVAPSWDRFVVALPFGRGVYVWGEPIEVPRGADGPAREAARQAVEDRLNRVTAEADRLAGRVAIEPDLAPGADR